MRLAVRIYLLLHFVGTCSLSLRSSLPSPLLFFQRSSSRRRPAGRSTRWTDGRAHIYLGQCIYLSCELETDRQTDRQVTLGSGDLGGEVTRGQTARWRRRRSNFQGRRSSFLTLNKPCEAMKSIRVNICMIAKLISEHCNCYVSRVFCEND